MIILKIIMCILLLLAAPMCMGLLLVSPLERGDRSLGLLLPAGYMVMMVSFELVTVPIFLLTEYQNFIYVVIVYSVVLILLSALGVLCALKKEKRSGVQGLSAINNRILRSFEPYRVGTTESKVVWVIALSILVVILILVETRVIFDGDDAFYVAQSLVTQQNGTMYVTQPYTGKAAAMDTRHALAVFTMWIAYIGKLTGIHTTILCHTVLPLVIIPLTFLSYLEIGIRVLRDKKEMIPYFCVFMELLVLFGRVSIYTPEAFMLARTWQGKSMAANMLIPMTFLSLLVMFGNNNKYSRWLMLIVVNAAAGIFSSLAVVLVSLLILVGGFVITIKERKLINMISACVCCIPGGIYMLLYVYFTYWGWQR